MEYFISALKNYAVFTGRAQRKAYWFFVLFSFIFSIPFMILDSLLGMIWLDLLYSLAIVIPAISVTTRRLHDTGRSGWWQLLWFIPLIGTVIIFIFLVLDSHDENRYGPNPKAP